MATRKLFASAVLFVVLCLGMTACRRSDDVDPDAATPTKTVVTETASPTPSRIFVLPIASGADEGATAAVAGTQSFPVEPIALAPTTAIDRSAFIVPIGESIAPQTPAAEPQGTEAVDQQGTDATDAEPATEPPPAESQPVVIEEGCLDAVPVADVTIPDGSILDRGETFTKIWRVRNAGACEWSSALGELTWAFVGGEQMSGPNQVPIVVPVPPGSETNIEVELTAPQVAGQYEGRWQVQDANGDPVGVVFWVLIEVPQEDPPSADAPPADPGVGGAPPAEGVDLGQEVWRHINGERDLHKLYQLAYNPKLTLAAQKHADDCSQRGSCSHTGSDGSDEAIRVQREGYQGTVDESWAWSASPLDAVSWWLDEVPPNDWHRRMLLTDYLREVGVGVAPAPSGGHFFVAVFGTPGR